MTAQQEVSKRGGLPDGDADLAALASSALGPSRGGNPAPAAPPQPAGSSPSPTPSPGPPQPRAARTVAAPESPAQELDDAEETNLQNRFTQVTSIVDVAVLERFGAYQDAQKAKTGAEPANTVVVFEAINAAMRANKLGELSRAPEADPDDFLAIHTPGRRTSRERRKTDQLSWRPTFGQLGKLDTAWKAHFKDRSQFINAVLDDFLPELKPKRRPKK
ncbi:hypothetical protein [Streptomyces sp. NPDC048272]|uniref:hypothetical protein n=1 Tax=Streptomyces sp. NPDC048272 TaxID=3154616 RepID=UPI0034145077